MMCFVWSDHVDEWGPDNDGMINIFCNDKECFKREIPLLKTEAWVFPAICNFELLAAKSFPEVVCKNCFLMQFKFAPVLNKTIVSSLKLSEKTKVILIKYFLEDIWVNTFKKSSGICSMFEKCMA